MGELELAWRLRVMTRSVVVRDWDERQDHDHVDAGVNSQSGWEEETPPLAILESVWSRR